MNTVLREVYKECEAHLRRLSLQVRSCLASPIVYSPEIAALRRASIIKLYIRRTKIAPVIIIMRSYSYAETFIIFILARMAEASLLLQCPRKMRQHLFLICANNCKRLDTKIAPTPELHP